MTSPLGRTWSVILFQRDDSLILHEQKEVGLVNGGEQECSGRITILGHMDAHVGGVIIILLVDHPLGGLGRGQSRFSAPWVSLVISELALYVSSRILEQMVKAERVTI